ncbi:MAG TPA: hypothetical protein VNX88_03835 [Terriglobales bacterium]|jgi:hypothetical protein|nr:hypothetical protein [Terriglobales bacterium]
MAIPEKGSGSNRAEQQHHHGGHSFGMDIHPERYPRESLSRLEEGILDDNALRHAHDRLGFVGPDLESRVEDSRNLSRTLMVLGGFLLIYAWVLLVWVGWDVGSGNAFFSVMCTVSGTIGLALVLWGYVERRRVLRLRLHMGAEERRERIRRFQGSHPAA